MDELLGRAAKAVALATLVLASAGCGGSSSEPSEAPLAVGQGIPQRILAVAPSISEILFALDLGDRVVGVGDYAAWPEEALAKPRVGGLFDPRFEEIVALEPDLAILVPSESRLKEELGRLGIETMTVAHETLHDLEEAVATIARRAGVERRGQALIEELNRELAPRRRDPPPRVLLLVGREREQMSRLTAVGSGTFLAELLPRLGADNILADAGQPYPQIDLETIIERQPQLIIELLPQEAHAQIVEWFIDDWTPFGEIEAVERGCVRVLSGSHVVLPGPRLPRLFREMEAELKDCLGEE